MRAPTTPRRPRTVLGLALGLGLGTALALSPAGPGPRASAQAQQPPQFLAIEARWCLEPNRCIALEVAATPRQQALGLQLRPPLPPLRGMWFPYAQPTPTRFWMHRTPEPLDMLFVAGGRVIAIEAAAQPCPHLPCRSYGPDEPVDGVIELAAGQATAQGITLGTPVRIERLPGAVP
ncbi:MULTISPECIES: DUF192 domain-containing protein [Aphanothece]|uniref:DUF192 domain-containing protein n=1 Tax=Aphanothece TaxID=1121 RepID=UPI0039846C37